MGVPIGAAKAHSISSQVPTFRISLHPHHQHLPSLRPHCLLLPYLRPQHRREAFRVEDQWKLCCEDCALERKSNSVGVEGVLGIGEITEELLGKASKEAGLIIH